MLLGAVSLWITLSVDTLISGTLSNALTMADGAMASISAGATAGDASTVTGRSRGLRHSAHRVGNQYDRRVSGDRRNATGNGCDVGSMASVGLVAALAVRQRFRSEVRQAATRQRPGLNSKGQGR